MPARAIANDLEDAPAQPGERMLGARIVLKALVDQGVEVIFGYPGGAVCRSTTSCSSRTSCATSWCATSRRRCMRPKAMRARPARSGVRAGDLGAGRHQRGDRPADALMDSIPLVCHYRPGADPSDRQRRLPGSRHHRHHAALHQAQLSGEGRRRPGARRARGVLCRAHRPAGPGGGRPAQGRRCSPQAPISARQTVQAQDLPAADQARPEGDRARRSS